MSGEDETVECLKPIAIIAAADEDISAFLAETGAGAETPAAAGTAEIEAPEKPEEPANVKPEGRVIAAPAAKKLALEKGIDISLVTGTGPNGRIVIKDVEDYIENEKTRIKVSPVAAKIAQELNVNVDEISKRGQGYESRCSGLCE